MLESRLKYEHSTPHHFQTCSKLDLTRSDPLTLKIGSTKSLVHTFTTRSFFRLRTPSLFPNPEARLWLHSSCVSAKPCAAPIHGWYSGDAVLVGSPGLLRLITPALLPLKSECKHCRNPRNPMIETVFLEPWMTPASEAVQWPKPSLQFPMIYHRRVHGRLK